jgi:hypothetical protein
MVNAINDADPRMYYGFGMLGYVAYPVDFETFTGMYGFKVNGVLADEYDEFEDYTLANGMLVKVSESDNAVWSAPITPATVKTTPVDATIAAEDIEYWVGTGSDSLVFAVNWGNPDTALAWGLKFNAGDSLSIMGVLQAVCAADSRLSSDSPFTTINYSDGEVNLSFSPSNNPVNVPQYILNGNGNVNGSTKVAAGDFLKIGESAYAFGFDSIMGFAMGAVWTTEIHPVSALDTVVPQDTTVVPVDATIAASDIVYWVGEGSNQVVFAVNWADTALAWGYKFGTDSVSVQAVMAGIAEADPRFSFSGDQWLTDIYFVEGGDTLRAVNEGWWMSTLNGNSNASTGMTTMLGNGDMFKWGDYTVAVTVDTVTWATVFTDSIYAVSVPVGINEAVMVDVTVWPNPASEVLYVRCETLQAGAEVAMFDLAGRKVFAQRVAEGTEGVRIATAAMPAGIYMLRVGNGTAKVVVRH